MKGAILPDHMGVNHYELSVLGLASLTFTAVAGIESETTTVDLPDRTTASGGEVIPSEFTARLPLHHLTEQAIMRAWLQEGRDPVSPTYKKVATLIYKSISGQNLRSYQLVNLFPFKEALPDLEMANDGEMAENEWTFKADDIFPI